MRAAQAKRQATRMFSEGIFKVGVRVNDIQRSIRFYRDILGWELVRDARHSLLNGEEMNSEVQASFGIPEQQRGTYYTAHLASRPVGDPETRFAYIELVQFDLPRGVKPFDSRSLQDIGGAFFLSFQVTDIERAYDELTHKGVEFVSAPKTITVRTPGQVSTRIVKQVFFRDPDGTILELVEFTSR